jgi:transposase-like protein
MEQVPRQQYTKEFREQAVRLVLEQQVTIPEAARRLAMSRAGLSKVGVGSCIVHDGNDSV